MSGQSPLTRRLIADGIPAVKVREPGFGVGPAWRRGIMHSVERIDGVLAGKGGPTAKLAAVRAALDELTEFQRQHMPGSYEEAFRLCAEDLAKHAPKRRAA